ncbi:MAG: PDZ domain-containing protein [Cytophagales bacterium]|nr:PDZ domain-containing protein [Bernardetiaceae bacterium]MDW8204287.1 PDZ domain-containing protein [Cytophagales bacterium]
MKKLKLFVAFATWWLTGSLSAQQLSYQLSIDAPHTHYVEVEMRFENLPAALLKRGYVDFKMPVWAPGSYLIREFAKNVEGETAKDLSGNLLKFQKINKNNWRVQLGSAKGVVFSYRVYAFEQSVRTSFVDESHAFISPSGIFMFPDGFVNLPSTLRIKPYKEWKEISCTLEKINGDKYTLRAPNYDELADAPIEIGNHKIISFMAAGVPHQYAMYGVAQYDEQRLIRDTKAIIEAAVEIFGELPCKEYLFIVHNLGGGATGGLEHLNSTVLAVNRNAYQTPSGYLGFLRLAAHEYFHLWNVKRLRPDVLGPFDYDKENYTRQLWMAEGFTSYYDDLIVRRARLIDENAYLRDLVANINEHENSPGSKVQSVAEASFDAWIKYYRRNENSINSSISYYGSGARVAMLIDLEILHHTKGQKSLDDVMRALYNDTYKKANRGFTEAELKKACELAAGKNMDEIFDNYVYGTAPTDYEKYLAYAGLRLSKIPDETPSLGMTLADENNRIIVKVTRKDAPAYNDGINVNDEIIAIDGFRMNNAAAVNAYIANRKIGETIKVTLARDGLMREMAVKVGTSGTAQYSIVPVSNPTAEQQVIFRKLTGRR